MVADLLYPLIMCLQRKINGQFPSKRFDDCKMRIQLHIAVGSLIIYGGTVIHLHNELQGHAADEGLLWRIAYQILAVCGVVHALTTAGLLNQVMGERRITIPLYAAAGIVNLINSIDLLIDPSLANAFQLWGSMNTFIFVRFGVLFLSLAPLDWNLLYTYSMLNAAFITYPLTLQPMYAFWSLIAPVLYSPFHELVCQKLGWHLEDPKGNSVKDTSFHDNLMTKLGLRKETDGPDEGPVGEVGGAVCVVEDVPSNGDDVSTDVSEHGESSNTEEMPVTTDTIDTIV